MSHLKNTGPAGTTSNWRSLDVLGALAIVALGAFAFSPTSATAKAAELPDITSSIEVDQATLSVAGPAIKTLQTAKVMINGESVFSIDGPVGDPADVNILVRDGDPDSGMNDPTWAPGDKVKTAGLSKTMFHGAASSMITADLFKAMSGGAIDDGSLTLTDLTRGGAQKMASSMYMTDLFGGGAQPATGGADKVDGLMTVEREHPPVVGPAFVIAAMDLPGLNSVYGGA